MTKRIISLAVVAMLIMAVCVIPASADSGGASTYAYTCDNCGSRMNLKSINRGNWVTIDTWNCTHYGNGRDEYQRRYVWETWECPSCPITSQNSISRRTEEYRTNCVGYNK